MSLGKIPGIFVAMGMLAGGALTGVAAESVLNLAGDSDLNHADSQGIPVGYKLTGRAPAEGSEEIDAREYLTYVSSGENEGCLQLQIPEGKNLSLSQIKPVSLEGGGAYIFSVLLNWQQLDPTGPGLPAHGPCFIAYVHSVVTQRHLVSLVGPSGPSKGWVRLEIPIDVRSRDDFRSVRLLFATKDITGTILLKDATLRQVDAGDLPEIPQFVLPDGEKVPGPKLIL